jgi:hypothetical protein
MEVIQGRVVTVEREKSDKIKYDIINTKAFSQVLSFNFFFCFLKLDAHSFIVKAILEVVFERRGMYSSFCKTFML